jgi:polyisoprenoid-binding protein YceI
VLGFTATVSIDRRDYGLTWNQALEAGGILVGNENRTTLSVQANPASPHERCA